MILRQNLSTYGFDPSSPENDKLILIGLMTKECIKRVIRQKCGHAAVVIQFALAVSKIYPPLYAVARKSLPLLLFAV